MLTRGNLGWTFGRSGGGSEGIIKNIEKAEKRGDLSRSSNEATAHTADRLEDVPFLPRVPPVSAAQQHPSCACWWAGQQGRPWFHFHGCLGLVVPPTRAADFRESRQGWHLWEYCRRSRTTVLSNMHEKDLPFVGFDGVE